MIEQQEAMHAVIYPGHIEPLIAKPEGSWCYLALYDEAEKHRNPKALQKILKNLPQRLPDHGSGAHRLDHLNYFWTLSSLETYPNHHRRCNDSAGWHRIPKHRWSSSESRNGRASRTGVRSCKIELLSKLQQGQLSYEPHSLRALIAK